MNKCSQDTKMIKMKLHSYAMLKTNSALIQMGRAVPHVLYSNFPPAPLEYYCAVTSSAAAFLKAKNLQIYTA